MNILFLVGFWIHFFSENFDIPFQNLFRGIYYSSFVKVFLTRNTGVCDFLSFLLIMGLGFNSGCGGYSIIIGFMIVYS